MPLFNWRTGLALVAIAIVTGTIFYSNYLAKKIERDEREKVNVWVQSLKTRATVTEQAAIDLTNIIATHNTDIPIIETDENDKPSGEVLNLDTLLLKTDSTYLRQKIAEFKKLGKVIKVEISSNPLIINQYYYGDSKLLKEVRYYPLVQLFVVALFIIVVIVTISVRNKSTQNQVWAGMAKETAHQLGTPLSSLQGWMEILKETPGAEKMAVEMKKDVDRLQLVSERFGKIGSKPQLEAMDIVLQVQNMVAYIRRRATDKVQFFITTNEPVITALINGPLFDWVIENLLKNALDAMEGQGDVHIVIRNETTQVIIDVTDTGKGISTQNINRVFKPGFTTKKRGWGLGLSLSKRIIEQYHGGEIFVKNSEPGKGTTFRIVLSR
ncbi:MAG TPA: HAMP domain-containing sensor histidine kinase [Ferruginibacter sp.]|nr:HAMP domain-containing sensor histidine kinase [Ferruginibacter sp.]HMP20925.1 HAMP domain-containing sensor histidine kinase [Ferruginibacter sp.]